MNSSVRAILVVDMWRGRFAVANYFVVSKLISVWQIIKIQWDIYILLNIPYSTCRVEFAFRDFLADYENIINKFMANHFI